MITDHQRPHLASLDILRTMAILLIVYGHAFYTSWSLDCGTICLPDAPSLHTEGYRQLRLICSWVFTFHLPLFFLLAGVCYRLSEAHYASFSRLAVRKLRRLMLPCFATGLLFMIPLKYLAGFYSAAVLPDVYFRFLTVSNAYGHLWFLPALFWIFLLFWLLHRVSGQRDILLAVLGGVLYACGAETIYYALPGNIAYLAFALSYFFWFVLGYLFQKYDIARLWQCWGNVPMLLLFGVLSIGGFALGPLPMVLSIPLGSLTVYSLARLLAEYSLQYQHWFQLLLRYNFYIYLFHDPFNYLALSVAIRWNLTASAVGIYSYQGFRIFGTVLLSLALGFMVDKLIRWGLQRGIPASPLKK